MDQHAAQMGQSSILGPSHPEFQHHPEFQPHLQYQPRLHRPYPQHRLLPQYQLHPQYQIHPQRLGPYPPELNQVGYQPVAPCSAVFLPTRGAQCSRRSTAAFLTINIPILNVSIAAAKSGINAPSCTAKWKYWEPAYGNIAFRLTYCLEIAWESRTDTDVNNEHSPPPWKTQTLTLSGKAESVRPWEFLMGTSHGSAFVASILHLASNNTSNNTPWGPLTDIPQGWAGLIDPCWLAHDLIYAQMYDLPQWMERTPWGSFQKLQTVSLAYAHVRRPFDSSALITTGSPLHVEVLMLSASLLRHPVPWVASGFIKRGPGEECIVSDDVRFKVSRSRLHFRYAREDWQKVWACGFGRYDSKDD
ncbi:hypothetical protein DEU56DRAFT_985028 [Suillus clintonianus]|uniref:uncharacterized protein n=1 Tax=Suillus clintonianus TaxID=1904413 RepID=UPI001B8861A3|nr:uncharacterized protein DEU56DRAFT_985028 [Suillus clintonianus]KAG2115478.1 hypothetical protein DEU56DRAFT_985028 [Suillus clintonianus]